MKPFFDYEGGIISGSAFNSDRAATLAFAFMISSLLFSCIDVFYILPTCKVLAENIYSIIRNTIMGLKAIDFKAICIIIDNNAINRNPKPQFVLPPKLSIVYHRPNELTRSLFFTFDTAHILKCIRNSWLNEKTTDKFYIFLPFSADKLPRSPIAAVIVHLLALCIKCTNQNT